MPWICDVNPDGNAGARMVFACPTRQLAIAHAVGEWQELASVLETESSNHADGDEPHWADHYAEVAADCAAVAQVWAADTDTTGSLDHANEESHHIRIYRCALSQVEGLDAVREQGYFFEEEIAEPAHVVVGLTDRVYGPRTLVGV